MKPVRAGRLKHRVTLEDYPFGSLTQDDFGEEVRDPQTRAVRWAAVEPLRGNERFQAEQVQADVTHKITMRYAAGLAPKMRIRWGDRIFEILFAGNVEEVRRMTEVLCKEVV